MPNFDDFLKLDDDGKWVYDDGQLQAVFDPEEMQYILSYEPRSNETICEIAKGIMSGSIFSSDQCPPRLLTFVFMILALMGPKHLVENILRDITLYYEMMSKAVPRGINGYPIFLSCQMMNRDEHRRLREELKAMGAFDGQSDSEPGT